jgi:hypothetical protein
MISVKRVLARIYYRLLTISYDSLWFPATVSDSLRLCPISHDRLGLCRIRVILARIYYQLFTISCDSLWYPVTVSDILRLCLISCDCVWYPATVSEFCRMGYWHGFTIDFWGLVVTPYDFLALCLISCDCVWLPRNHRASNVNPSQYLGRRKSDTIAGYQTQ